MTPHRVLLPTIALTAALGCSAPTESAELAESSSQAIVSVDPGTLTPNPVANSDEGTAWACREVADGAKCDGDVTQEYGGFPIGLACDGWSRDIFVFNGTFSRQQTRSFNSDSLESHRLVHESVSEDWSIDGGETTIHVNFRNTSQIDFGVPGDLDSRQPNKGGIDLKITGANGVVVLNVGRATALAPDTDYDQVRGHWDGFDLGAICTALGSQL